MISKTHTVSDLNSDLKPRPIADIGTNIALYYTNLAWNPNYKYTISIVFQ